MANPIRVNSMTLTLSGRSSTQHSETSKVSGSLGHQECSTPSTDTFAGWIARVKTLTPNQRKEFLAHSRPDLGEYVQEFEEIAKRKSETSKARKVAKFVKPLYELCRVLAPIVSDNWLSQVDPTHSSLVLGGVAFVLSFSGKFLDYHEKVIERLSTMLEKLHVVERFEILYSTHEGVLKAAVQVCEDILEFCVEASKLFLDDKGLPRSSFKLFATSVVSSVEEKFGPLERKFEGHRADFESYTSLALAEGFERLAKNQELRDREDRRMKMLQHIPAASFEGVQNDRLERSLEGTGQWLFNDEKYKSWLGTASSDLLWVYGKHGCGKSYLAARVIDHLSALHKADGHVALAYIYCNPLDSSNLLRAGASNHAAPSENSAIIDLDRLIGSLLRQLVSQIRVSVSLPGLEKAYQQSRGLELSRPQMKEGIIEAIEMLQKCLIVVDGLDECHKLGEKLFKDFCNFLASLARPQIPETISKVVVFSRPSEMIERAFSDFASVQVDGGANTGDIEQFISTKLSTIQISREVRSEITEKLVSRAEGMFLWVDLISRSLQGEKSVNGIRKAIKTLPSGLEMVYQWSMERILSSDNDGTKERALKILLWATNAFRPLSCDELLEALAIEPGMTELGEDDKLINDDGFTTDCADLIVKIEGHYRLIHSSLKDYLEGTPKTEIATLKTFADMQAHAQETLSEACLTYLGFESFKGGPVLREEDFKHLLEQHPFFHYASLNWGKHLLQVAQEDLLEMGVRVVCADGIRNLLMQSVLRSRDWKIPWDDSPFPFPYTGRATSLHVLAIFDLACIAQRQAEFSDLIYDEDGLHLLAFIYGLIRKSHRMCIWILERHLEKRANKPGTPDILSLSDMDEAIHWASYHDWGEVVKILVQLGARIDKGIKGPSHNTPLHLAAKYGAESALEALLKGGADPNNRDNFEKETPLALSVRCKRYGSAEILLRHGANPDLRGGDGNGPIHQAAYHNILKHAELLLARGAQPDLESLQGFTALFVAIQQGNIEIAHLLMDKYGADPKHVTIDGQTTLHQAAISGSTELLPLLLAKGVDPLAVTADGNTVIHKAAASNKVKFIEELVTRVPELRLQLEARNSDGLTPIHEAAKESSAEAVEFLLKYNPAFAHLRSNSSDLPLHVAAQYGRLHCVKILFTEQDMNLGGNDNETPLLQSIISEHMPVFKYLIEKGADVNKGEKIGLTPLIQAAGTGKLDVVNVLLAHGATPDLPTRMGLTALRMAVAYGSRAIVTKLIDAGADPLFCSSTDGQTPFMEALSASHPDIVDLFFERGADGSASRDLLGETCLLKVASTGNGALLKKLLEKNLTLAKATNCNGEDLMIKASFLGWFRMIPYLEELGIPVDGLGSHALGLTPLMIAAWNGRPAFVDSIIQHGANVEKTSSWFWDRTALHWATSQGRVESTIALLEGGADPRKLDGLGYSSLDYARDKPELWNLESMAPWTENYSPLDHSERQPLIRFSVVEASSTLLRIRNSYAASMEENLQLKFASHSTIFRLAFSLAKYGSAESLEDSKVCYAAMLNPPESGYKWEIVCYFCRALAHRACVYYCCSCDVFVCRECYKEYLDREQNEGESMADFEVLRKLEEEVRPVRIVCEPIRQDGWLLAESFVSDDDIKPWASNKLKEYNDWNKNNNKNGRLQSENFPGWCFVEIVSESQEQWDRLQESGMSNRDAFENITLKLKKNYVKEGPDAEILPSICCGHRFQEIPEFLKLPNDIRDRLDQDWYVSAQFLRELCDRYGPGSTASTSLDYPQNGAPHKANLGGTATKNTVCGCLLGHKASSKRAPGDNDSKSYHAIFSSDRSLASFVADLAKNGSRDSSQELDYRDMARIIGTLISHVLSSHDDQQDEDEDEQFSPWFLAGAIGELWQI